MTAFMMRMVLDRDGGYEWLDSPPVCLSAAEHRPAYGSDGDYWSKPNREEIVHAVYALMREAKPREYPELW
jgi:2-oxoisovalerate dehydrogenase E1 component